MSKRGKNVIVVFVSFLLAGLFGLFLWASGPVIYLEKANDVVVTAPDKPDLKFTAYRISDDHLFVVAEPDPQNAGYLIHLGKQLVTITGPNLFSPTRFKVRGDKPIKVPAYLPDLHGHGPNWMASSFSRTDIGWQIEIGHKAEEITPEGVDDGKDVALFNTTIFVKNLH